MSLFSAFLKKHLGIPEVRLDKVAKARANAVLEQHKAALIAQIDLYSAEVSQSLVARFTADTVRREAHRAIEKVQAPAHIKALVSLLVDSMDLDALVHRGGQEARDEVIAALAWLKGRVRGMRL